MQPDPRRTSVPSAIAPRTLRTVWVSDIHLGTRGSQAEALFEFLRATECEKLYLVGDLFDGWQLSRAWYWPESHERLLQLILRKARTGTQIIFIPGNHDAFARRYAEQTFAGVQVLLEDEHVTADGRRLWVTHGDQFDRVVQKATWLARFGHVLYELLQSLNVALNAFRKRRGLPYWSLSRYMKRQTKHIVGNKFDATLTAEAQRRGAQGVVCGHIHHAEMRTIDGIVYCNDGDWVESLTALLEHEDGRLELLDCSELRRPLAGRRPRSVDDRATPWPASILKSPDMSGPDRLRAIAQARAREIAMRHDVPLAADRAQSMGDVAQR